MLVGTVRGVCAGGGTVRGVCAGGNSEECLCWWEQ